MIHYKLELNLHDLAEVAHGRSNRKTSSFDVRPHQSSVQCEMINRFLTLKNDLDSDLFNFDYLDFKQKSVIRHIDAFPVEF